MTWLLSARFVILACLLMLAAALFWAAVADRSE
jgi:hypothetical protein